MKPYQPFFVLNNKKPNIVHVSEVLATGVLEFIYSLVTEIKEYNHTIVYRIRELGHDDESVRNLFPPNVKLVKWKSVDRLIHPIKDSKAAYELYKHLKSIQPDLIHLHSSKAGILGRLIAPLVVNKNAIIYTPNGAPFARTDITSNKQKLYKYCEKMAGWFSGNVVCVSESESMLYNQIGIPSIYINNGVQLQQKKLVFEKSHINKKLRIVSAGRVTNQKDPIAFNKIAQHYLNNNQVEFIWIGDGKKKKHLTSPNITITGWLKKNEVINHLQKASLYLSTALWEGLPFSVLEAMSVGMPVVISRCTGNIDLIEDKKSGFLFENDKECIHYIDKFIAHPNLINEKGKEAWNRCNLLFSKAQMAFKYKTLYDQLPNKT